MGMRNRRTRRMKRTRHGMVLIPVVPSIMFRYQSQGLELQMEVVEPYGETEAYIMEVILRSHLVLNVTKIVNMRKHLREIT
jgi:hypothetical protein